MDMEQQQFPWHRGGIEFRSPAGDQLPPGLIEQSAQTLNFNTRT